MAAGIALADRVGLDGVSMRRLAQELGVNPMSLYHHVQDKDALLTAMVDAVVEQITPDDDVAHPAWTDEVRSLLLAARTVMLRHPWAVRVLQAAGPPSPATMRQLDRVLAAMRRGGCSVTLAHHALHLLGSRVLGFSQDLFVEDRSAAPTPTADATPMAGPTLEAGPTPEADAGRAVQFQVWAQTYPYVVELARAASHEGGLGGCDDEVEFAFALDVLLDGLERRRLAEAGAVSRADRAPGSRSPSGSAAARRP